MTRRRTRGVLAAVAVVVVGLALAPSALAHAVLEGSNPARGAVVASAPDRVTLRFDESVEGNFQALRVFDSKGDRVDTGQVERPNGRGDELSVGLRSGLADGSYTATYRVISADSHPVSGGFVFSIGAPGAAPAQRVNQLIAASGTGRATDLAFGAVRFVNYAAIALALGGLAFLIAIWLPALARVAGAGSEWGAAAGAFERRARWLLVGAVVAGIVSGLLGIVLQGATAAGISVAAALDPGIVREVLGTRFGRVWMARVIAWVVLGGAIAVYASGGFRPALRPARLGATGLAGARVPAAWKVALLAVPAAFIAITPALGGHASTQSPSAALIPLDVAHVVAMSLWTGGLAMLLFVLPAATRRLEPPDRSRLLAAVLVRFSPLALACVILLLATGVAQSWIHIGAAGEVLGTAFGRAALIKFCLLLVLIGLGAVNRQRVVPRLRRVAAGGDPPGAAGRLLRRTLRAEVALIAVVLAVTAALVNFAPPGQAAVGPFSTNATIGPAHLEMTVEPALVGANEIHLYLFNAADGSQYRATKQLRVLLSLPDRDIGPIEAKPQKAGPGHWVIPAEILGVPGDWEAEIINRVSAFDEYTTTIRVPIRPAG